MSMVDSVQIYFTNRRDFYATLLPRIPQESMRTAIAEIAANSAVADVPEPWRFPEAAFNEADPWLTALALRDILKKPQEGRMLGRTTLSLEEALERCKMVEETGILLFESLARSSGTAEPFSTWATACRNAATELERLTDELRFHRRTLA